MPLDQAEQFPFELEHNGIVVVEETDELFTGSSTSQPPADWIIVGRDFREGQPFRFLLHISPRLRDVDWVFWPHIKSLVDGYERGDFQQWQAMPEGDGHFIGGYSVVVEDPFGTGMP